METLFQELKRYVKFDGDDEEALRKLHPIVAPHFVPIAERFYARILEHNGARSALEGGESMVGRLKVTLVAWMERLFTGPWDESYFELRCRIGRVHVRIALPQHYMFGAMNVVRQELNLLIDAALLHDTEELRRARLAVGKILDLELAIMLHTYREDLLAQQTRVERLSTFGQLVGSIGHELRNPLGVIESSLYIIKGRIGEDARAIKHVDRINEQLGLANNIISALLDMIRDKPLAREPVDPEAALRDVVEVIAVPPGVTVHSEGFGTVGSLDGDPTQLKQVLRNLLENAVHAAGKSGEVWAKAAIVDGAVEIAVEDTGPGVDAAIRKRLFEPLMSSKAGGIGLGLALVKRIVERHGGTVSYAPREGGGSRFLVRLPRGGAA